MVRPTILNKRFSVSTLSAGKPGAQLWEQEAQQHFYEVLHNRQRVQEIHSALSHISYMGFRSYCFLSPVDFSETEKGCRKWEQETLPSLSLLCQPPSVSRNSFQPVASAALLCCCGVVTSQCLGCMLKSY